MPFHDFDSIKLDKFSLTRELWCSDFYHEIHWLSLNLFLAIGVYDV